MGRRARGPLPWRGGLVPWRSGPRGAAGRPCGGALENPELPFLLFLDGESRALANPLLLAQAEAGRVTSAGLRALARNGARWGESRPPNGGGRARPVPADTTTRLLGHLLDAARKAFTGGAAPHISWRGRPPVAYQRSLLSAHEADRGGPSRLGFAGGHEQAGHLGRIAERAQDDGLAPDRREVAGRQVGQPR